MFTGFALPIDSGLVDTAAADQVIAVEYYRATLDTPASAER